MKKLIISDGLKSLIEMGKSVLSRGEIKIFTAQTGDEILKIHKKENADLIITYLDMRGMNGDEVTAIIRSDDVLREVSIIIICEKNKYAVARCHSCRANTFMTTPLESEELFRNIRKFLYIAERKNIRVIFKCFIKGEHDEIFFYANSENISATGILFETDEVLKKGDNVTCSFFIEMKLITASGRVMRVEEKTKGMYNYGVQFTNLSPNAKAGVEGFIRKIN
jgi:response regulator RpfG family c-di-GMP phosphodiesterase